MASKMRGIGGGDTLAAGAHGEGGGREGLAGVGREEGGWRHLQGPEFFHLTLQPPVFLRQRPEVSLQILGFHLRLLQLCPEIAIFISQP